MKRGCVGIVIVALMLAGCESSGGGTAGGPGRGSPGAGTSGGAGEGVSFSAGQRATMDVAWRAFKENSPGWPVLREDWIAIGPQAVDTLVDNLFRAMILSRLGNFPEGYDRARRELMLLGEMAVPTLAAVLERSVWRNEPIPSGLVAEIADLLVIAGEPSVPYLRELMGSRHAPTRRGATDALGRIGDPAGYEPIAYMLSGSPDWIDRMTAAKALGYMKGTSAPVALIAALEDPDVSVVQEVARSLARLGAREAIPALENRRERARTAGEYKISAACGSAVNVIRRAR